MSLRACGVRWRATIACVAGVIWPALAAAQGDAQAAAEALFRGGRRAALAGDHAAACEQFRESQRLEPAIGTLLNLAICEERLGHLVQAWQHYHRVIEALPPEDTRRTIAAENLARLEPRLPRLVVRRAASAPKDTRVRLGQLELSTSTFGAPIPVNPGVHTCVVSAPNRGRRTYVRRVGLGERVILDVEPGPPTRKARIAKTTVLDRTWQPSQAIGYGLAGLGVASLITAGVTGWMVIENDDVVERECPQRACSERGWEAARNGNRLALWSTLSFWYGVLAVGSGTYLLLAGPDTYAGRSSSGAMLRARARF